jgi:hypothetical protein
MSILVANVLTSCMALGRLRSLSQSRHGQNTSLTYLISKYKINFMWKQLTEVSGQIEVNIYVYGTILILLYYLAVI